MLKIFADECINADVLLALRRTGFDVLGVQDAGITGADDADIFEYARRHKRILLTFDRGFGDIFRFNIAAGHGVIIVLTNQMKNNEMIDIVLKFTSLIKTRGGLSGQLAIIGRTKIRIINR